MLNLKDYIIPQEGYDYSEFYKKTKLSPNTQDRAHLYDPELAPVEFSIELGTEEDLNWHIQTILKYIVRDDVDGLYNHTSKLIPYKDFNHLYHSYIGKYLREIREAKPKILDVGLNLIKSTPEAFSSPGNLIGRLELNLFYVHLVNGDTASSISTATGYLYYTYNTGKFNLLPVFGSLESRQNLF